MTWHILTQAQAIVVGFLASMFAMVMGWIPEGKFNMHHALLLCASSMCTAALASFVLGEFSMPIFYIPLTNVVVGQVLWTFNALLNILNVEALIKC